MLDFLFCNDNSLISLNVKNGNNTAITGNRFNAINNPDLTCIEVDNVAYSITNWAGIDAASSFSEDDCRFNDDAYTYVPDNNFEQALIDLGYDTALDDFVLTANINTFFRCWREKHFRFNRY